MYFSIKFVWKNGGRFRNGVRLCCLSSCGQMDVMYYAYPDATKLSRGNCQHHMDREHASFIVCVLLPGSCSLNYRSFIACTGLATMVLLLRILLPSYVTCYRPRLPGVFPQLITVTNSTHIKERLARNLLLISTGKYYNYYFYYHFSTEIIAPFYFSADQQQCGL